jgi:hypothetical protein
LAAAATIARGGRPATCDGAAAVDVEVDVDVVVDEGDELEVPVALVGAVALGAAAAVVADRVIVVVMWRTVVEPQPAARSDTPDSESTSRRRAMAFMVTAHPTGRRRNSTRG